MPKIDPTDQFVPIIELPSKGSNVTVYLVPPNSIGLKNKQIRLLILKKNSLYSYSYSGLFFTKPMGYLSSRFKVPKDYLITLDIAV